MELWSSVDDQRHPQIFEYYLLTSQELLLVLLTICIEENSDTALN